MFRRPDRTIVPQYSAPEGLSLLAAAELLGAGQRAVSAQIVDLAVRRALTIAPLDPGRSKRSGFTLTLRTLDGLGADELDTMQALFPRGVVGETVDIRPGRNAALGRRLRLPHGRAVARLVRSGAARERGWFERTFSRGRAVPIVPLPPSNVTVDHLWGMRDYIALAEKDRLAFLQSPRGALVRGDGAAGVETLLLNERLLPYAVLFGLEREWIRELGLQYEAIGSIDPAAMQLLGDMAFLAVDADGLEALMVLGDLAETLVGVGRIVGGVGLFLLDIAS